MQVNFLRFKHRILLDDAADGAPGADNGDSGNSSPNAGFSQDEVNKIVADRVSRAQKAAEKKSNEKINDFLLDNFGVSVDEIDTVKDAISSIQNTETEAKKQARQLETLRKELADAQQAAANLSKKELKRTIDEKIGLVAKEQNAHTRSVIAELRLEGGLELDDSGAVLANGVEIDKAVKNLISSNPHLLKARGETSGAGSRPSVKSTGAKGDEGLLTKEGRAKAFSEMRAERGTESGVLFNK